jgi:AraC-like DNA-binding protein
MKLEEQHYFGDTLDDKKLEDFYISITSYHPNTKVEKHFHKKPYLCLLMNGLYQENRQKDSEIIKTGTTLFRPANHEHSNNFSNQKGVCLNMEINKPEEFFLHNNLKVASFEQQQKGSIDVYKLLFGIKNNLPKDVLNIYCYESIVSHFNNFEVKGQLNWIQLIKDQIRSNPFASISLTELSIEFGLHTNYIVRKFKEVTGFKLSDYLNKTRIEESLTKLISSEKSLSTIAYDSGFYDQSHFNRNFKKYFSSTPKEFRKGIKG